MNYEFRTPNELEILRLAEQERGKAMGAFFRWLFVDRDPSVAEHANDAVAAE